MGPRKKIHDQSTLFSSYKMSSYTPSRKFLKGMWHHLWNLHIHGQETVHLRKREHLFEYTCSHTSNYLTRGSNTKSLDSINGSS